jgi:hypothetical protein
VGVEVGFPIGENVAVAALVASIVTLQVGALPAQAPPQPRNVQFSSAFALSTTVVPRA